MKRMLERKPNRIYHYRNGKRVYGLPPRGAGDVSGLTGNVSGLTGDVSGLTGNVSGLTGNVSGLTGDVSGLTGNVIGLTGDVSGLTGNVDDCDITPEDRKAGVNILDLFKEATTEAANYCSEDWRNNTEGEG